MSVMIALLNHYSHLDSNNNFLQSNHMAIIFRTIIKKIIKRITWINISIDGNNNKK